MKPPVIKQWHATDEARDLGKLDDLLAENATFESPIVHTPQVGKKLTSMYLKAAAMMLVSGGTFKYENEWIGDNSAVLEFTAEINNITINGIDMIFWNDDDKIERFKVMIRPLKAIELVHQSMQKLLAMGKPPQ